MAFHQAQGAAAGHPLIQRADAAYRGKAFGPCRDLCRQVLKKQPHHVRALTLLASASLALGQTQEARGCYEKLTQLDAGNSRHALNLAKVHIQLNEHEPALTVLQQILDSEGWDESVEYLKALCLSILGQTPQAIASYSIIIERNPQMVAAYTHLAALLVQAKQHAQAVNLLELATAVNPKSMELVHSKAKVLLQQGLHAAALVEFERLEALGQRTIDQVVDHAELCGRMKKQQEAERQYELALDMDPKNHRALTCYARWLSLSKKIAEALEVYDRMVAANPADTLVLMNMGNLHGMKRDFVKANAAYGQAFHADPHAGRIAGSYLYSMSFLCDWKDHARAIESIEGDGRRDRLKAFQSVVFQNSAAANLAYAKSTIAREFKPTGVLGPCKKYTPKDKIRIGYFSADFYNHATVMLMEGMLRAHDRDRFELHAFSLDLNKPDEYTQRVKKLFDHYHEVKGLSDRAVTYLSRQLEIDIAIDLKGFTEGSRTRIFSERAAPIQLNYLGYPGTMGADFIDYMVADRYTVTPESRSYFSEKVIYMPDCYQPNNPQRPNPRIGGQSARPDELPRQGFVFCSFNNTYKINPSTFDMWLRILRQADQSVLWLLRTTPQAEQNLLDYVRKTDIEPARIIFAKHLPEAQHLQRLAHADLFLDTFPCNAHTTASDSLWAGVPLITRSGETFASRVAGSILHAVGLQELIADSQASYEALALKVYNDRAYHRQLRQRLHEGVEKSPLYDVQRYTRDFERALLEIHERHHRGQAPQDLDVAALSSQKDHFLAMPA